MILCKKPTKSYETNPKWSCSVEQAALESNTLDALDLPYLPK